MLQSFIVYGIMGLMLSFLGWVSYLRVNKFNISTSFWSWEIILAFFVFTFFSGVRWKVGVDYISYYNNYLKIAKGFNPLFIKEVGFDFITQNFARFGLHFSFYFAFFSFFQIYFIYRTFNYERYLYPFLGVLIIFGTDYLTWMNGMRQSLAATMFVFSIQYITKRDLLKYFFVIFLASLFHKSAILLLVFFYIPQKDYFKNRYINLLLVGIATYIGFSPFFLSMVEPIVLGLKVGFYQNYIDNLDYFFHEQVKKDFGPRRLILLLINCFTIWYAPKLKQTFKSTNYLIYFNFAFFGFLYFSIFANTSHIFLRFVSYFSIFSFISTSYLLYYLKRNEGFSIRFILVFIISILYLLFSIIADYGKGKNDFTNYKFYWDNINK
jgi:hypothetical protein